MGTDGLPLGQHYQSYHECALLEVSIHPHTLGAYAIMADRTIGDIEILNGTLGSRIDKYICHVQNDRTPMPYLLAGGIGVMTSHVRWYL